MGTKKRVSKAAYMELLKRQSCPVMRAGITEIDYKDVEFLKLFLTQKGKIIPRRISRVSARTQTKLTSAIKQARHAGLLSFSEGYVQQDMTNVETVGE